MNRRDFLYSTLAGGAAIWIAPPRLFAQSEITPTKLSREEMEEFLQTAKLLSSKPSSKGITGTQRATLSDGHLTHDAHIMTIDESKSQFTGANGVTELNFRDTYKFNIAAYRLDKIMDLRMIPATVERKFQGNSAAFDWFIDDVLMDEQERVKKNVEAPNVDDWNRQMFIVRTFDQLIFNTDRNLGNLLITKDWKIWMIDHGRAFRMMKTLRNPKNLVKCDRKFLDAMRNLDRATLDKQLQPYLRPMEIEGLLARRDLIVQFFDKEVAAKGEQAILYDYLPRT
ncbi:MAG: hypothetical protein HY651_03040 [Acidobacteria bacterium]|nr:hypothetical protein [Acidobacteriota bacterium]